MLVLGTSLAWAEMDGAANEVPPVAKTRPYANNRAAAANARADQRGPVQNRAAQRNNNQRGDIRAYPNQGPRYQDGPGAGPEHQFRRGDRLPNGYRNSTYVVDDWRGHRLSAPPRGYHWVQTGGDYVLVAIATGIILQILLAN
jgi:Ni/Co efflux regulator RcnB